VFESNASVFDNVAYHCSFHVGSSLQNGPSIKENSALQENYNNLLHKPKQFRNLESILNIQIHRSSQIEEGIERFCRKTEIRFNKETVNYSWIYNPIQITYWSKSVM
jgi:hypothetical protein